jgi:hypothetical protein
MNKVVAEMDNLLCYFIIVLCTGTRDTTFGTLF